MTNKTIINHVTLAGLLDEGMTEGKALTLMSRMRALAAEEGKCVTRLIRNGKVQEQIIWVRGVV